MRKNISSQSLIHLNYLDNIRMNDIVIPSIASPFDGLSIYCDICFKVINII